MLAPYRINPLSLVEIILYVARQMPGEDMGPLSQTPPSFWSLHQSFLFVSDPKDAITFLEKTKEKVSDARPVLRCRGGLWVTLVVSVWFR